MRMLDTLSLLLFHSSFLLFCFSFSTRLRGRSSAFGHPARHATHALHVAPSYAQREDGEIEREKKEVVGFYLLFWSGWPSMAERERETKWNTRTCWPVNPSRHTKSVGSDFLPENFFFFSPAFRFGAFGSVVLDIQQPRMEFASEKP